MYLLVLGIGIVFREVLKLYFVSDGVVCAACHELDIGFWNIEHNEIRF